MGSNSIQAVQKLGHGFPSHFRELGENLDKEERSLGHVCLHLACFQQRAGHSRSAGVPMLEDICMGSGFCHH